MFAVFLLNDSFVNVSILYAIFKEREYQPLMILNYSLNFRNGMFLLFGPA